MRILFVSDTHIGFDWPTRPRIDRRRRGDDFLDNFERALAVAHRGDVDVVVHGGDLLFRSRVPAWISEAALAPLRRVADAGIPVLLVPGNHERSRVSHPLLAIADGLHVFDRPRTVVIERRGVRAAFVGFPYARDVRQRFADLVTQAGGDNVIVHDDAVVRDEYGAPRDRADTDVRILCVHHCIEGATCGPGNFVFRTGADVIRRADLPADVTVTLSGHIHRHQVLRPAKSGPVIYAGSVERTSFAEAPETKGFVILELTRQGLGSCEFRPLPARPMVTLAMTFTSDEPSAVAAQLAAALATTPSDAVVQIKVEGTLQPGIAAVTVRALAGARNVTFANGFANRVAQAAATVASAGGTPAGSRTVKAVPSPKRLSTVIAPPIK